MNAVGAIPKLADATEALRGLGFSDEQIEGMQAEWRRAAVSSALDQLTQSAQPGVVSG